MSVLRSVPSARIAAILCSFVLLGVVVLFPLSLILVISVFLAAAWCTVTYRHPVFAVAAVLSVVEFSSHLLSMSFTLLHVPAGVVASAIVIKDALGWLTLTGLFALAIIKRRRVDQVAGLVGVAALALIFVAFVPAVVPLQTQVQSVRNVLVSFMAVGTAALIDKGLRAKVVRACLGVTSVGATYGLIQLAFPTDVLKNVIGIPAYWIQVKQEPLFISSITGMPGNFFTTDGFPRLTGAFGDPLSAGMILGASVVLAATYVRRSAWATIQIVLLSVALLLTFTRDGWLLAAIGTAAALLVRYGPVLALGISAGVGVLIFTAASAIPAVNSYLQGVFSGGDASTLGHQAAFARSLDLSFALIGSGWGTGGSAAANTYSDAVTEESSYVAILAQLGWLGGLLLLVFLGLALISALRGGKQVVISLAMLVSLGITGTFSENLLTFNGAWFPFLTVVLVATAPGARASKIEAVPVTISAKLPRSAMA